MQNLVLLVRSNELCHRFTMFNFSDQPCPDGWISDDTNDFVTCYYLSSTNSSENAPWKVAVSQCKTIADYDGAHLVDITSTQEMVITCISMLLWQSTTNTVLITFIQKHISAYVASTTKSILNTHFYRNFLCIFSNDTFHSGRYIPILYQR